jgi:hypothetical protein
MTNGSRKNRLLDYVKKNVYSFMVSLTTLWEVHTTSRQLWLPSKEALLATYDQQFLYNLKVCDAGKKR